MIEALISCLWFDIILHYDIFTPLFQLTQDISSGFKGSYSENWVK